MADELHHIQEPSQLDRLSVRRLLSWRAPPRIVIDAGGTPQARVQEWERGLSHLLSACGCEQGGAGLILGMVGYLLFLLLRPGGWGDPGSAELWVGAATLTVTSTAGKVIGLRLAQRELKRTVREIRAQWVTQKIGGNPPPRGAPHRTASTIHKTPGCCGGSSPHRN